MDVEDTCSETELIRLIGKFIDPVAQAYQKPEDTAKPAGYFALRSSADSRVLLLSQIRDNPVEKVAGRYRNALEKGERLYAWHDRHGHVSSWQSRHVEGVLIPEMKQWGGAIFTERYILSFSGLPELADEALMVIVAVKLGWLRLDQAMGILMLSNNVIGLELLTRFCA